MSSYLVTGGCGFIGSHLSEALLAHGHAVRVLDDLSTGTLDNLPKSTSFICGSVNDPATVSRALDGMDGCYHLAAIASVERCRADWAESHRVNQTGTIMLLEAIARRPIPVVYASSAAVYGNNPDLPLREDASKRPTSAYGIDKFGSELHARIAAEIYAVPTAGLRFFNVYGPRQDPASPYSGVISIFADRIRRGDGITIYGDGASTRDFVCVADVARALLATMSHLHTTPAAASVFNVCTGQAVTILDLAHQIATLCDVTASIRNAPPRIGDIMHSLGDATAATAALGLPPPTPLADGLRVLLDWMAAR